MMAFLRFPRLGEPNPSQFSLGDAAERVIIVMIYTEQSAVNASRGSLLKNITLISH